MITKPKPKIKVLKEDIGYSAYALIDDISNYTNCNY